MKTMIVAAALTAMLLPAGAGAAPGQGPGAQIAGSKSVKVTQVYQHALPGVPGKSLKGVLVEYGPGGYSPSHRHATLTAGSAFCA